jgi:hypothetical protein
VDLRPIHRSAVISSHNGTPIGERGKEHVLDKIIAPDRTEGVVSTVTGKHGDKNPVPYPPLMAELGQLAANARLYPHSQEQELRDVPQPQRTDLEPPVAGQEVRFLPLTLDPVVD